MSSALLPGPAAAVVAWPLMIVAFALGSCIGSFLNVCIHRLPADESIVHPRSRCPGCRTQLAWHDNIPLLSWLWLRARCRACGQRISPRYPLVELATGALAVLALAVFGSTPAALVAFAFSAALLLITFIDLDHRIIPDEVSLPGILIGLGVSFLPGGVEPIDALGGALLGGGLLWAIAAGYERLTGVEGMGYGDVKLLGMIGAFLGWQAIPAVLVVASIVGSIAGAVVIVRRGRVGRVVRRRGLGALVPAIRHAARRTEIPFGPFLAFGALLALYMSALHLPLFLS